MSSDARNLFSIAASLYAKNAGIVPRHEIRNSIMSAGPCVEGDADAALTGVDEAIKYCINEIHKCIQKRNTENLARESLGQQYPALNEGALEAVFRYSSWCVAKGA